MMLSVEEKMTLMKTNDASKDACSYRLRIARMAAGLEAVDLAKEVGLTIQTYSHQENARANPSKKVMRTLFRGHGIDYNFMMEGEFSHLPADLQSRLFAAAADLESKPDRKASSR